MHTHQFDATHSASDFAFTNLATFVEAGTLRERGEGEERERKGRGGGKTTDEDDLTARRERERGKNTNENNPPTNKLALK